MDLSTLYSRFAALLLEKNRRFQEGPWKRKKFEIKQTNKQSNKETNIFDTKWGGMNFPSRRPNHSLRILQEPSLLKFCHRFLWLLRQPFPILPPSNNDAFFPNFEPTKSTPMGGGGRGEFAQPDGGYSTLAYTGASTPKGTFSPSQYA